MKNIEKKLQESWMIPIFKQFKSSAECVKDSQGNYFWSMQIARDHDILASITIRLEHEPNTHSGAIIHFEVTDCTDDIIHFNNFKFSEPRVIDELKLIIEMVKNNFDVIDYYIL